MTAGDATTTTIGAAAALDPVVLIELQRQTLSAARLEIGKHGAVSIAEVARRLGITDSPPATGWCASPRAPASQRADGRFVLEAPTHQRRPAPGLKSAMASR